MTGIPQQRVGDRSFASATDVSAYLAGRACWPAPMPARVHPMTPFGLGWADSSREAGEREAA